MRKLILLIILLLCVGFGSAITTEDLVFYYALEEAASPFSDEVSGQDATCTSCPTRADGVNNYGQYFDRSSNQVILPPTQLWNFTRTDCISFSSWVNITAVDSLTYHWFAVHNTLHADFIYFEYSGTNENIGVHINGDGGGSTDCDVATGSNFDNDTMHNVVFVHNGTDLSDSSVYIDGRRYTCDISYT